MRKLTGSGATEQMGLVEESQIPENRTRNRVTDERKRLGPAGEDCDSRIAKRVLRRRRRRNEGEKNNRREKKGNKLVFRKSERNCEKRKKLGKSRMNN